MNVGLTENYLMWSAAEIAARDGVSKQAVSKTIQTVLSAMRDVPVERDGRGRIVRISLAHYDHHRERYGNPAKAIAQALPTAGHGDSFDEARRQSEWLKVNRERISLNETAANLIRTDKTIEALALIEREMRLCVDQLPNRADDLAAAITKEGVHGARVMLQKIAFDLGTEIADRIDALAAAAPETDPPIEPLIPETHPWVRDRTASTPPTGRDDPGMPPV